MPTQKKIDTVTGLTEKAGRAKTMILTDYRGLKHKQLEELRKLLKKSQAEFMITKNRLFLRALQQGQGKLSEKLETFLNEPTATLFAYADEVAPLKELLKFFKNAGFGKTKAGLLGAQFLSDEDVTKLSDLPPREILLGTLVAQLNAPIQGLHSALSWNINKLVWGLDTIQKSKVKSQN